MITPIIVSTFTTVFLAELGDKTQIATLTLSSTTKNPLAVFLGSASALIFASLIGALAGGSIALLIPPDVLKAISACAFLILGIVLVLPSFKS
tara:strand:+ start:334 stop:612 length:279 start_codon:yes stop_codon:yes gene_type:complete